MANLKLKVEGVGTRKQLADALRALADNLHSDYIEEIYEINGASYNDDTISVILTDLENE